MNCKRVLIIRSQFFHSLLFFFQPGETAFDDPLSRLCTRPSLGLQRRDACNISFRSVSPRLWLQSLRAATFECLLRYGA